MVEKLIQDEYNSEILNGEVIEILWDKNQWKVI